MRKQICTILQHKERMNFTPSCNDKESRLFPSQKLSEYIMESCIDTLLICVIMHTIEFLKQRQLDALGAGQFGKVYKGHWTYSGQVIDVAIKVLSSESDENSKIKFLQEAAIMSQFRHPNVIKLYGVVSDDDQVCTYTPVVKIRISNELICSIHVLNIH